MRDGASTDGAIVPEKNDPTCTTKFEQRQPQQEHNPLRVESRHLIKFFSFNNVSNRLAQEKNEQPAR